MRNARAVGAVVLLLAACGGGDNGDGGDNAGSGGQPDETAVDLDGLVNDAITDNLDLFGTGVEAVVAVIEEAAPDVDVNPDELLPLVQDQCADAAAENVVEGRFQGELETRLKVTVAAPATKEAASIVGLAKSALKGCADHAWVWVEWDNRNGTRRHAARHRDRSA